MRSSDYVTCGVGGRGEMGRSGKEYYAIKVEISSEDGPRRGVTSEMGQKDGDFGGEIEKWALQRGGMVGK